MTSAKLAFVPVLARIFPLTTTTSGVHIWLKQGNAMKIKLILPVFIAVAMCFVSTVFAGESGDYIKVEVKGTLQTHVMAIGGEITGTIIRANNVTWELDFGDDKELQSSAEKLDQKTILVTGTYEKKKGIEVKERHIIKVATLKATEEN
jgi:hypothetical protein